MKKWLEELEKRVEYMEVEKTSMDRRKLYGQKQIDKLQKRLELLEATVACSVRGGTTNPDKEKTQAKIAKLQTKEVIKILIKTPLLKNPGRIMKKDLPA